MSNVDEGRGEWEFVVRRVPGGVGTVTLFDKVPVGAEITLDGPFGLAYLRADSPRDLVLVGGGSGLAPMLSLARGAVKEPSLAERRIHVFYGARTLQDLAGEAELRALPGFGDRLTFHPVLSEAAAGTWDGATGYLPAPIYGRILFRAVRRNDHVGRAVDIAQRRVKHRKRRLDAPRRKRVPDFDDQLAQLLLVGFGLLELGDKAFDLG